MTHTLAGARGKVEDPDMVLRQAQRWAAEHNAEVLVADASVVFGPVHLESAVLHAERARDAGTMATRSLAMESLLYLTGCRQVSDAIRIGGLRAGTAMAAVVVFGSVDSPEDLLHRLGWTRDDKVLLASGKSLERLGITRDEERTLSEETRTDLALERTALLDVEK